MIPEAVDIAEKFGKLTRCWTPKVVASLNDYQVKIARMEGVFVWHAHDETDELFIVFEGSMDIEFRDGVRRVSQGQMIVVPRGVEHRPAGNAQCKAIIIEPAGVRNTGNSADKPPAPNDEWV